jgi:hypothetical protein
MDSDYGAEYAKISNEQLILLCAQVNQLGPMAQDALRFAESHDEASGTETLKQGIAMRVGAWVLRILLPRF